LSDLNPVATRWRKQTQIKQGDMVAHQHLSSPRIPHGEESSSPSALVHDDEDSEILGNNIIISFPSPDEGHLTHDLMNNTSWMKEDVRTDEMEDDELEKEMEMLALAEKEVSQEISDIQRSFHNPNNQWGEENEQDRRKLNSTATPTMNEIEIEHTEKLEWGDTNCMFQEQRDNETTNQKLMKVLSFKRKTHANISNIHEVETDMIERDTRDSVNESQPSDEACYGVYSICNRDPPEAILFVDDDESYEDGDESHDEDSSDVIGEIVYHMSLSVSEDESVAGSAEMYSLKEKENFNESPLVERRHGEEEDPRSGRLSDLGTGGNDNLFREEMFVGDIVHTTSNTTGDESAQGSAERYSPDAQQDDYINESCRVERRQEEEESDDAISEWDLRSNRQLSDLERGKSNVFEEEIFWEESFWRAQRVHEPERRDSATLVRKDNQNTTTKPPSAKSSIPFISGSRRSIIDILSLPTLEPRRDENEDIAATLDLQSVQSIIPGESVKLSVHDVSTERISQMESNHSKNNELIYQEASAQIFDHTIDDSSLNCIEEKQNSCSFIPLDPAVLIDEEEAVVVNKRRCQNRKGSCDLRRIIIAVHVLLALSGVIVFWKFLLPKQGS